MKAKFYALLIVFFLVGVQSSTATVRTVSNNEALPAQYSNLQTAIDASAAGDTLHVMGSATAYGTAFISKRIVIIGNGLNMTGTNSKRTSIGNVRIWSTTDGAADNTVFMGIDFSTLQVGLTSSSTSSPFGVNGLTIIRCLIEDVICTKATETASPGSDLFIIQSVNEGYINQSNFKAVLCENSTFISSNGRVTFGDITGSYIYNNCTFLGYSSSLPVISNITSTLFQNCVIVHGNTSALTDCIFRNCLTFGLNDNNIAPTGVQLINCIIGQDPKFVKVPSYANIWQFTLDQLYTIGTVNLALQAGSPCIGAGLGGTNLGTSGGSNAFDYYKQSFAPIPRVKDVTIISGQTLPAGGGSINVQIQAVKGN